MDINKKFEKGKTNHTYQRIDSNYKVNIFLGYNDDGNMSMIITEEGKIEKVKSSKLIDVRLKRRSDNKLALSFDLMDLAYTPMFTVFCKDMIVVCERAGKEMAIASALIRWKYWKEMFGKKSSQLLEKQLIKGLMGELLVLKEFLIPKYGPEEAVKCWRGPLLGHKDFEIERTWYEVKTINDGATQFVVSSMEQLESETDGHLAVVRLNETSENNEKALNINSIALQVMEEIQNPESLDEFRAKLESVGFLFESEYDNINFTFVGLEMYTVNDRFPRLRRSDVHRAIGNAKYSVLFAGITEFKE